MKIGYKGFKKGLECRGEKFEIGKIYQKYTALELGKLPLKLCTDQGWHYCEQLEEVHKWYSFDPKLEHVFAKIEILGNSSYDYSDNKGITNVFRIIEIIEPKIIENLFYDIEYNLPIIRKIQEKNHIIIGGSLGLILHGIDIGRKINDSDIDIMVPYYNKFENVVAEKTQNKTVDNTTKSSEVSFTLKEVTTKKSGNDFDYTLYFDYKGKEICFDVRIDPKTKYEIVKYNDYEYRVASIYEILEAKCRYALQGNEKHQNDIKNMINKTKTNLPLF